MGRITTHVLDTAAGKPAAGLKIVLTRLDGAPQAIATGVTNADGRLDKPLLEGAAFAAGHLRDRVPRRRLFPRARA